MRTGTQVLVIILAALAALYAIKQHSDMERFKCETQKKGFYFKGKCIKDYKIMNKEE